MTSVLLPEDISLLDALASCAMNESIDIDIDIDIEIDFSMKKNPCKQGIIEEIEKQQENDETITPGKTSNNRKFRSGSNSRRSSSSSSSDKKHRVKWTPHLHACFLTAIDSLSPSEVVPSKILEIMIEKYNVQELTREHVSSHLQKYRLQSKKRKTRGDQSTVIASVFFPQAKRVRTWR